ncbi:MAG: hypothetical protein KGH53_02870 [Candidatus Micrarchaeota archaeon]|nr:hypothetical protein [Candidatus Micrarchaeota archaeon]
MPVDSKIKIKTMSETQTFTSFFNAKFGEMLLRYNFPSYETFMSELSKRNPEIAHAVQIGVIGLKNEYVAIEKETEGNPASGRIWRKSQLWEAQSILIETWAKYLGKIKEDEEAKSSLRGSKT